MLQPLAVVGAVYFYYRECTCKRIHNFFSVNRDPKKRVRKLLPVKNTNICAIKHRKSCVKCITQIPVMMNVHRQNCPLIGDTRVFAYTFPPIELE